MDEINILAESVIKIEEVKQEPDECMPEPVWNFTEEVELSTLKSEVKKEDFEEEELEPSSAVFLEPKGATKEEVVEEYEDPLALCNEGLCAASEDTKGKSCPLGGRRAAADPTSEFQRGAGRPAEQSVCGCSRYFSSKRESLPPVLTNTGPKALWCPKCKKCSTEEAPDLPVRDHVKDASPTCSVCQKKFTNKSSLVRHMQSHMGKRLFECSVCQKRYKDRGILLRHLRVHTGKRPFECSVCHKSFTRREHLINHMRIHTGKRPFECSICQKSFKLRHHLIDHMSIHTGQKPFECSVCKKSFTHRRNLDVHLRIHTGQTPFECSVCNKSFKERGDIVRHIRIHTGQRPFECTICQKSFKEKPEVARHMQVHVGQKPFECSICKKSYKVKISLVKHMLIHTAKTV